eukprot:TRINITY_DN870_c0_g1_i2.p2 TRINITY_DN870_c0_g1~~TRINITY_DN870_c0_g1_i2.p2  ORF type:complete len:138 (-),score=21.19 TRINITY_DN870_c0_g1_i2:19-432(-)
MLSRRILPAAVRLPISSRSAGDWRSPFYSPRIWDKMEDPSIVPELPPDEKIIKIHAMKHYPQWDFRSYETHTDIYAHWNEYTPVYYGTDTYPIEGDRWDKGSKIINSQIPFLIFLSLIHICRCRRSTLCRSRWSPYH